MLSTVQIAVVAAVFVHTASAYSSYMELIPNGENIGKGLGHKDGGGYTDFGTMFSDAGTEWSKVCSETWPGGSVTCGAALGDPCCTWKSGTPDYTLSEPNTDGTTCSSASTATSGGGASAAASAAASTAASGAAETTAASGTTDDSATQASNTTDSTAATTDSSEYCE